MQCVCVCAPHLLRPPRDLVITKGCVWSELARSGLSVLGADKSGEDPDCQASKDKAAQVESWP